MAKMAIIVEVELENDDEGFAKSADILDKLKPIFQGESGVKVYGAVKETADAILLILSGPPYPGEEDGTAPEDAQASGR